MRENIAARRDRTDRGFRDERPVPIYTNFPPYWLQMGDVCLYVVLSMLEWLALLCCLAGWPGLGPVASGVSDVRTARDKLKRTKYVHATSFFKRLYHSGGILGVVPRYTCHVRNILSGEYIEVLRAQLVSNLFSVGRVSVYPDCRRRRGFLEPIGTTDGDGLNSTRRPGKTSHRRPIVIVEVVGALRPLAYSRKCAYDYLLKMKPYKLIIA